MQTTICDVPCNVVVTSFTQWKPATWYSDAEGEIIWEIQNLDGTPAPELEAHLTTYGRKILVEELISQCTNREEDY